MSTYQVQTTSHRSPPPPYVIALLMLEVAIGVALSRYGVRFDGFIDVHRTPYGLAVPMPVAMIDQVACVMVPLGILAGFIRGGALVAQSIGVFIVAEIPGKLLVGLAS